MLGAAFRELPQTLFTLGCGYFIGTAGSEMHGTLLNTICGKTCQYPLFKNIFRDLPLGLTAAFNLNYCIVSSLINNNKKMNNDSLFCSVLLLFLDYFQDNFCTTGK